MIESYDARTMRNVHPDVVATPEFKENFPTRKPAQGEATRRVPLSEALRMANEYYNLFPSKNRRREKK